MTRRVVPYKIKVVEPIRLLDRNEREKRLKEAGYNVFNLRSDDVYIDLLTDSGTGAISTKQQARSMLGDESYAGSLSFFELQKTVHDVMGFPILIPAHQGRAAEHVLDHVLVKPGQVVLGNTHFDTTKAHIEYRGARAVDCTIEEGRSSEGEYPFKGNVDIAKLDAAFAKYGKEQVAYCLVTITCNSGGGQPVSMANIKEVSHWCKKHGVRLFFDAARFAENAYFIKLREKGYQHKNVKEISREMFDYGEGCTMSAKKDGLVPIGGFIAIRDEKLYEELKPYVILFEGFYTYGGMSGLDMEVMAQGLKEVVEESYLEHRIDQGKYLGGLLAKAGIPIVHPVGGHAVFIDGRKFFPKVPEDQFPSQMLVAELYKEGGVRTVEVGSNLAGRDPQTGANVRPSLDLCRLCIPRRVYTQEHFDYVADVVETVWREKRDVTKGMAFDVETKGIRHFTSTFRYL